MIFWGKSPSCSIISTVSPYIEVMWRHLIGSLITEIRDSEIVESEHLRVFCELKCSIWSHGLLSENHG